MITDEMVEAGHAALGSARGLYVDKSEVRAAIEAALAAMPQEPVAWRSDNDMGRKFTAMKRVAEIWEEQGLAVTPLFASPVQGAPAVKWLEWYPDPGAFPYNTWGAQSSFGRFIIEEVSASDSPAYEARYTPHHLITIKDSLEAAQAAAQADFERRIRSCLTGAAPSPSEEDEPSQDEIDAWLLANCGAGIPHGEAETEGAMLHGLAYVLRQIEHAPGYRPNIGQVASATSALRMALNRFALIALRNSRAKGAA